VDKIATGARPGALKLRPAARTGGFCLPSRRGACYHIHTVARFCFLILLLVFVPPVRAGHVRTLDGKEYSGPITLEPGQLVIRPIGGEAVRVGLEGVLSATFRSEPGSAQPRPARWTGQDIGAAVRGSSVFSGSTLTVRAGGTGIGTAADSCYFVYQRLTGDGQIVARVLDIQQTDRRAKAGLMIRASVEPAAPFVMVAAAAGGGIHAQQRARLGAHSESGEVGAGFAPVWLRLMRRGGTFTAYRSEDGATWQQVASETVNMPPSVLIGVAVSSHNSTAICKASFASVQVQQGGGGIDVATDPRGKGVMLRSGSVIGGAIRSADQTAVRLARDRELAVPLVEVARMLFAPVREQWLERLRPGRTGVLLSNGDFLEGTVLGVEAGQIRVSSVLFGLRQIQLEEVVVAVLRDAAPVPASYQVKLADGSDLLADRVSVEKDALVIEHGRLGMLQAGIGELVEIRAGAARFVSLADLRPVRVDAASGASRGFAVDATVCGLPMSLNGQGCERGISLAGAASATWTLEGGYRMFLLRFGVPDGVLPSAAVRLVITLDGKEIYRSPERTALDAAVTSSLNVGRGKTLELRVEALDAAVGACGLIAEPALVK